MLEWLNKNDAAVVAVATVTLVLITGWYAWLTGRISKSNARVVELMGAQVDDARAATNLMRDQLEAAQLASEAQIVHTFLERYFRQEMSDSLRTLRMWFENHPSNAVEQWHAECEKKHAGAIEVEVARRVVKAYFTMAALMRQNAMIRPNAFRSIAHVAGINVFYDLAVPLERKINPDGRMPAVALLEAEIGRYGDAENVRAIPPRGRDVVAAS